jgi:hypothetical protein
MMCVVHYAVAFSYFSFLPFVLSEICLSLPPQNGLIFSWSPSCQQHNLDFVFKINFRCIDQPIAGADHMGNIITVR